MEKENKINILIIVVFLILLVVPSIIFAFVKDKLPEYNGENRNFAEKPILTLETLPEYPKQFDDYYNDHLPFRAFIQRQYNNLNYYVLGVTAFNNVLIGKKPEDCKVACLFYDKKSDGDPLQYATGTKTFSDSEKELMVNTIKKNTEKMQAKDIELYYFFALNKSTIYKELLPSSVKIKSDKNSTFDLLNYMKSQGINNFVCPYEELMEAKNNTYVFYNSDTHWNDYGGFIGAKALHNLIDEEYSYIFDNAKITPIELDDFTGDLLKMLNITYTSEFKDKDAKVENFLDDKEYKRDEVDASCIYTNENPLINKEVMIIGDSFNYPIACNFAKIYSKVTFYPTYIYSEDLLNAINPDIVIIEAVERYIDKIIDLEL